MSVNKLSHSSTEQQTYKTNKDFFYFPMFFLFFFFLCFLTNETESISSPERQHETAKMCVHRRLQERRDERCIGGRIRENVLMLHEIHASWLQRPPVSRGILCTPQARGTSPLCPCKPVRTLLRPLQLRTRRRDVQKLPFLPAIALQLRQRCCALPDRQQWHQRVALFSSFALPDLTSLPALL